MLTVETLIKPQFYDLDPMEVVWHGNYVRYLEQARCELLDRIGYNYEEMRASGFAWPVVDIRIKYVRPIRLAQEIVVASTLVEYENRICINYVIRDAVSSDVLTKARTVQLAVDSATGELCFESPPVLIEKVQALV